MIPKVIHYCWFGGAPFSELALKCFASWKKICPDYEIKEWNENNFDVNAHPFTKLAYQEKKFSFVSDFARMKIIYENGGIYLDTDVELIKNIDDLLQSEAFIGTESFGSLINPGSGFGAVKNFPIIGEFLKFYQNSKFENSDGVLNMTPITCLLTPILTAKGWKTDNTLQNIEGMTVYPTEYFCPKDYDNVLRITENTRSIHHFDGSWIDEATKKSNINREKLSKFVGKKMSVYIWYLVKVYKRKGFWHLIKRIPAILQKGFRNKT